MEMIPVNEITGTILSTRYLNFGETLRLRNEARYYNTEDDEWEEVILDDHTPEFLRLSTSDGTFLIVSQVIDGHCHTTLYRLPGIDGSTLEEEFFSGGQGETT